MAQALIFPLSGRLVLGLFSKKRGKRDFLINVWRFRDGFLVIAGALGEVKRQSFLQEQSLL
jgi:hypothetical protein